MDDVRSPASAESAYDAPHLARNAANFAALTPLGFLPRAAAVYPDKLAVIHGDRALHLSRSSTSAAGASPTRCAGAASGGATRSRSWRRTCRRCSRRITACRWPGAVLNALNYRLDAALDRLHPRARRGQAADRRPRIRAALVEAGAATSSARRLPLVDIDDRRRRRVARRDRIRGVPRRGRSRARPGRRRATNGTRSRSTTPRAPPATRRASSITTAAPF